MQKIIHADCFEYMDGMDKCVDLIITDPSYDLRHSAKTHSKRTKGVAMTFLDICAGIGGFRLGMEQAGHKCVGFIEKDKFAVKSYRAMYDTKGEFYHDDIFTAKAEELPDADCWCFGFPCQSFSINGQRRGFDDIGRGNIIFQIMRLAALRKPKVLFAENVAGLLTHDKGKTFAYILQTLDELGYDLEWQVINSRYFVPQNRERVYIIGSFRGENRQEVFPIFQSSRKDKGLSTNCITTSNGRSKSNGTYIVKSDVDAKKITPSAGQDKRYAKTVSNINRDEWRRINTENLRIRQLTPKECWRLQGFSDELFEKAAAVNSDSQLYKQAGNSVIVPVIREIAKRLKK